MTGILSSPFQFTGPTTSADPLATVDQYSGPDWKLKQKKSTGNLLKRLKDSAFYFFSENGWRTMLETTEKRRFAVVEPNLWMNPQTSNFTPKSSSKL